MCLTFSALCILPNVTAVPILHSEGHPHSVSQPEEGHVYGGCVWEQSHDGFHLWHQLTEASHAQLGYHIAT